MPPSQNVSIGLLSDEDIPVSFRVMSKSFGQDAPFVNIYFPRHDTSEGQKQGSKRLLEWKKSAPNSTFLKATTKDVQGEEIIIGMAIWTHMTEIPSPKLEEVEDAEAVWPDLEDRGFMANLWKDYVIPRTEAIKKSRGKGIYVLELLAVHPDYQRQGAGKSLVTWGTRAADEKGLKSVVEGTPVARRLYESCGLQVEIEEMDFNVGEKFAGRKKPKLNFLTREPQL